jgi:hypothetical protein
MRLKEINKDRFGDFFTVEYEGDDRWVISNQGENRMWFWISESGRKVESGMPRCNWQQWAPTWTPEANKYPTFDDYLDSMSLWASGERGTPTPELAEAIAAIREADHKQVPEGLRPYAFPGETP